MSAPFDRVGNVPGAIPPADAREADRGAQPPSGAVGRALSVFRKRVGDAAYEPEGPSVDAIEAVLALVEGTGDTPAPANLAEQLLDYVTPRPRKPLNLTPSRVLALLDIAVAHVAHTADDSDEIKRLAGTALQQELRMHRELAARRATLLGPGAAEPEVKSQQA